MKRWLFLLLLAAFPSLEAVVEIVSRRPENHRIVRTMDQELAALFPFPRAEKPIRPLRVTFDRTAPKKFARLETGRAIEIIIRDDADWTHDSEVMEQLCGALFACRAGSEKSLRAPRFLLAAMRGELRGIANARRINRSNNWLYFVRALLAENRAIDYSCAAQDGKFMPVAIYQEEAAGILLYAARRRDLMKNVLHDILQQEPVTEKLLLNLDAAARKEGFPDADELLRCTAKQRAWHAFAPRPAGVSRRIFAELTQREIPELDPMGKPTGRSVPVDLAAWCVLAPTRSDAEAVRQKIRSDLHDFRRGETPGARRIINRLIRLNFVPDDYPEIVAAKADLEAIWREHEKAEAFLAGSEARFGGIGAHAPGRLDAIRHRGELLSPRGKEFLDRVEKLYSGE